MKQKKYRLTLSVEYETVKQAKMLAAIAGTTVSQLFENLINAKRKGTNYDK